MTLPGAVFVHELLSTVGRSLLPLMVITRSMTAEDAPSASAFVQQRQKLLSAALEELYHRFTAVQPCVLVIGPAGIHG